jgi:hypothetical protein
MKQGLIWLILIAWMPLTNIVLLDTGFGLELSIIFTTISAAIWSLIFNLTMTSAMRNLWIFVLGIGLLAVSLILAIAVIPDSLPVHFYSGLKIALYLKGGFSLVAFLLVFLIHDLVNRVQPRGFV